MARRYELKKRAERQQETRQRIVEAAVELHQTLGPARTTITGIAERAGVGRLTVYRHFPDELTLLSACSGLFWERNPFPDLAPLESIADPAARLRRALQDGYAYHRATEQMMSRAMNDIGDSPVFKPYTDHWNRATTLIVAASQTRRADKKLLSAAVAHALSFMTWRSLVREQGLSDGQAIDLMMRLLVDDC